MTGNVQLNRVLFLKKSIINIQFGIENRVFNHNFKSLGIANLDTNAYSASEIKLTFFLSKERLNELVPAFCTKYLCADLSIF